ncbi:MAG: transposase [Spirochaetales bacterium]|nr:transposase [Spirochaetales bacterium]
MSRYKKYEPKQHMFLPVDPEVMFPVESFERFVVDAIDQLDLTIFDKHGDDKGGETPYDPRSLLGIFFYGYAKGVFSSRKLSESCHSDLGFMFVSGYTEPEHSTLCRFLQNYGEEIRTLFSQILFIADNLGFLDLEMISFDGTKIKGNASKQFCGTLEDFKDRQKRLEKNIALAMEKHQQADSREARSYWENKENRYRKSLDNISGFLKSAEKVHNENGSERQQNITDNDTRILKSHGSYLCGYNAQAGVDVKSGIILTAEVIDSTNDKHAFPVVTEALKKSVPKRFQDKLKTSKFLADNGYYSGKAMAYAAEKELNVFIADGQSSALYGDPGGKTNSNRRMSIHECQFGKSIEGVMSLTCPGGITTTNRSLRKKHRGRDVYRYRIGVGHPKCEKCPVYSRCMGKTKVKHKDFEVNCLLADNYEFIQKHKEKLHSERGKRIYAKRMSSIERVFGNIKYNKGFTTFQRRGLENVNKEWQVMAISYNLLRMHKLKGKRKRKG